MRSTAIAIAAVLAAPLAVMAQPVLAQPAQVEAEQSRFEQDRQAILSQAGDFRVRFDMRETVPLQDGYEPLDEKLSGGNEIVRVVEDTGDRISLQHILVMDHEGETFVIKHWRQDWVYQPETVLTYAGPDRWALTPVDAAARRGAWSQTVWQTDDSPRYGGVGHWSYDNGMAQWTSNETTRPLARRDAVRDPVYDRYVGTNRHVLTPFGWAHLQDNVKMAAAEGGEGDPAAVVQEDVINTYRKVDNYDPKPGDDYWAATRDYWAGVRAAWDERVQASGGLYLEEEANRGAVTGKPLMDWAVDVQEGRLTTEAAIDQARALITQATTEPTS